MIMRTGLLGYICAVAATLQHIHPATIRSVTHFSSRWTSRGSMHPLRCRTRIVQKPVRFTSRSAERLDQPHARSNALAVELCLTPLLNERVAFGVGDLEVIYRADIIASFGGAQPEMR
jgi:hypothetical protein